MKHSSKVRLWFYLWYFTNMSPLFIGIAVADRLTRWTCIGFVVGFLLGLPFLRDAFLIDLKEDEND